MDTTNTTGGNGEAVATSVGLAGGPEKKAMAYVGRKGCGCVVAITWINPAHANDAELDAQEYAEQGLAVEYMPAEQARAALNFCHCKTRDAAAKARERFRAENDARRKSSIELLETVTSDEPANKEAQGPLRSPGA